MRNWFFDGFDVKAWDKVKKTIRQGKYIDGDDVFGEIKCGAVCFDLILRDPETYDDGKWHLEADAYLLGIDDGYANTSDGIPYTYDGGIELPVNLRMGYAHTQYDFMVLIEESVNKNKRWSEYADKTDIVWKRSGNDD